VIRLPLHILLVEDSPLDAALVTEQLRVAAGENPIKLTRTETVAEATAVLRAESLDCVLLDLTLPDASGLEALGQLHYVAPDVPIVVFSGVDGEDLAVRAVAEGAQDYLVKGQAPGTLVLRAVRYAVERKQTELQLAELAMTDALTGLPNRARLMDRVAHALDRTSRTHTILALLFLDLDRFKIVNDSLGHTAGDRLLYAVAERLRRAVRPADTVARFGGDEFVVLCEDLHDVSEAEIVVGRIHAALEAPVAVEEHDIVPSASIGVAISRGPSDSPDRLLRDADAAMYRAKSEGAGHAHFAEEMYEGAQHQLKLEAELHRALRAGELELHYQPQIDLGSRGRRIVGAEALLRWNHPRRGLIGPSEFIPTAEETGLIRPIGAWVLREACRQLAAWDAQGVADGTLEMSVNLSPVQMRDPGFVEAVSEALAVNGLAPERLCLEITESVLLDPSAGAAEVVRELRALGVQMALDDFGTGYASLSMLTAVKIDTLKIDRSFVQEMISSEASHRIVNAVAGLAAALGIDVVAEGVEDLTVAGDLAVLGCGRAQGFAFARPLLPAAFAAMVMPAHVAPDSEVRVFLCDDAPDLRHLLRVSLEEDPELRVTGEADDGAEIVAHVRGADAHVVLMDLSMPRVHGLQAVRALRTQVPGIGIIVLSGFEKERMLSRALQMGADMYIEKRAPLEEIRQAVRDVADAHRLCKAPDSAA
jgi:diguanylate cyclase (GGDEF)-like protein